MHRDGVREPSSGSRARATRLKEVAVGKDAVAWIAKRPERTSAEQPVKDERTKTERRSVSSRRWARLERERERGDASSFRYIAGREIARLTSL